MAGRKKRVLICRETADKIKDAVRFELKFNGRVSPEQALINKDFASRDAGMHGENGITFWYGGGPAQKAGVELESSLHS